MAGIRAVLAATAEIQTFHQDPKAPAACSRATLSASSREIISSRRWKNKFARSADRLGFNSFTDDRLRRIISAHGGFLEAGGLPAASLAAVAAAAIGGAAITAMAAGGFGGKRDAARAAVRRGMELFVENDVQGSVVEFDKALRLDPSQEPYLWQRGLSLYYLGRFQEAAEQFRKDVAVNPNDTEEAIWCFLSEAQLLGPQEARQQFLLVGQDPRPVMRAAMEVFKKAGDPNEILAAAAADFGRPSALFYANLYVGLYYESEGDQYKSKSYIVTAAQSPYGVRSGDYMAALARVHCQQRGWV
ncbi:hypothetical protein CLOM_g6822 [Closterium sp. NIES-68]|nr:hypothetical protein CLOM_g6822 [Closterium sp. NIES-68]GJP72354.1 hypothetical protein CLOP_g3096 [Closterium sp. NIES-67]GJP75030.1 hypothetical protein CLOP_g5526 [Closterium sp. NIES-67]